MSSTNASSGASNKKIIAIVLAVIAVLLIILGVMYFVEPAKSLLIGAITHPKSRADAHRPLWGTASLIGAVIFLAAAWFTTRGKKSGADSKTSETAKAASNS